MSAPRNRYPAWSECSSCTFQGMFVFECRADEDYDDPDLLGVMMDARCPSCDEVEAVLVASEQFSEMVFIARQSEDRD